MTIACCAAAEAAEPIHGFTEPYRTIEVAAAEPGIITNVTVAEGAEVKKNQLLATLDAEVLLSSLAVAQARAQSTGKLEAALAEQQLTENKLRKLKELRAKGHASQNELERAKADSHIARAKVTLAEEDRAISKLEYQRIQAQLKRREIRSPIDGFVSHLSRDVGEAIRAVDPSIMTLVDLKKLRARFSVGVSRAVTFKVGDQVTVRFSDTLQKANGKISMIAPVTDARSGTTQIVVVLDNSKQLLRSGMSCTLHRRDKPPEAEFSVKSARRTP